MKYLIAIVAFIATIYFSFSGANQLIHYICEGITDPTAHIIVIIGLWVLSFSIVLGLSLTIASIISTFLYYWIKDLQRSKERKRHLKSRGFYNNKK